MSALTWAAVVGSGRPVRLALVPVIGEPSSRATALGTQWSGALKAAVLRPPETRSETAGAFRSTRVRAPGMKASTRLQAVSGTDSA